MLEYFPQESPAPSHLEQGAYNKERGQEDSGSEVVAALFENLYMNALNKDALDYAMNLVGNTNQRVKTYLTMDMLTDSKFIACLDIPHEELVHLEDIMRSMKYELFSDEDHKALQKTEDEQGEMIHFSIARKNKAREVVNSIVAAINKKNDIEFATALASMSILH